ncbi:hypothetical protein HDU87_006310 [Geranomyces variabilis]|uniref:UmuC domain-containing protein n=1 Tax=Geranomyces variabilis TaxID=109894 RepID=A0AAD5TFN6_9FUNG|nr:hypothetical protein HDU87_006310 [Geranomyces variabilis]
MSLDTLPPQPRAIIQLDLDYFYAQAEEVRDPSLKGKPIAIQQKHIVVTCNYEARSFGIGKLALLTEAVKLCPSLVIIDGSDISRYRRWSRQIFELVLGIMTPKEGASKEEEGPSAAVEKLGMDELFIDCSEIIRTHSIRRQTGQDESNPVRFELPSGDEFFYLTGSYAEGHMIGTPPAFAETPQTSYLQIASHIAAFLRGRIFSETGFTSSAGVGHSKLFAKLAAGARKPNAQTCLLAGEAASKFFDDMTLRKIPGIGSAVRKPLQSEVDRLMQELREIEEEDQRIKFGALASISGLDDGTLKSDSLHPPAATVGVVRSLISQQRLEEMFGSKLATQVHSLLQGHDPSPIVAAALPQQISIEDSFPHCTSLQEISDRLKDLAAQLLERLQEEEWNLRRGWRRHARSVRLTGRLRKASAAEGATGSMRRAWNDDRETRSSPMPVDVWDVDKPATARASVLVEGTLLPLFNKLLGSPDSRFDCTLLNIAATNFATGSASKDIRTFFAASADNPAPPPEEILKADEVDPEFLAALPADIRAEIVAAQQRAGITKRPKTPSEANAGRTSKRVKASHIVMLELLGLNMTNN